MTRPAAPTTIRTTCPYCGVGCGVLASPDGEGGARIQGDPVHPANHGRLCSKGSALGETLGLENRLLYPEVRGRRVPWDAALDAVAEGFREVLARHGPEAVALYVSGQLLTEDYYVANKLMKGCIGSANIDTNSRLCMASSVAGHKRAFGEDVVPGNYEDLEQAELVVLVGSNAAWCHPVLFQRMQRVAEGNPRHRLVVIDPRRSATAELADLHLAIAPGSDVLLYNGLLCHLWRTDRLDHRFLVSHTAGFSETLAAAEASAPDLETVARGCGVAVDDVACFYDWFAETEKTVTAWSQGVNQSSSGSDKVNAILNVHLATGRIGRPGMGPLSLTGQPNAMGGREVGGLANQLAAHLNLEDPDHRALVGAFWGTDRIPGRPGLKAVELFQAVGQGRVQALWIMATNPAVSLPDVDAVRRALARCPLVVVSECEDHTDLSQYAHIRLPAAAWGEKEGTVTNSERRISRQRAFLPPPGEARPDWWMLCEVGRRLGHGERLPYRSAHQIFVEHARLSGLENGGARVFDLSGLSCIDAAGYDRLEPFQWPRANGAEHPRLFADGRFPTADGRARLVPVRPHPPAYLPDANWPLILNTGRIRDQWHTMTRTGRSPRLNGHLPEPFVEVHPNDATRNGLRDGALARVQSRWGEALARVRVEGGQRRGELFMPMHWSDANARRARVNALVNPAVDPLSGEPESKHTPVRIAPWPAAWYAFAMARRRLDFAEAGYAATVRDAHCWRTELAGETRPADWADWAGRLLEADPRAADWIDYTDAAAGIYRCVLLREGRLEACLYAAPTPELPPREWVAGLYAQQRLPEEVRWQLLAGRPAEGESPGHTVCACFGVGINDLRRAIRQGKLSSVEAVGAALKAGTNCGSCIPELTRLLAEAIAP